MPLVILLFAMFASIFTLQKNALNFSEPFFLVGSRMLLAGIILCVFMTIKDSKIWKKIKLSHAKDLFLLGLLNIYLSNVLEMWGTQTMLSSKVCLLYSLSPFIAALVAALVLKETLSLKKFIGMAIGFLGLLPIIFTQTATEELSGKLFIFTKAELAVIGAVFASVYGWIILKKLISQYNYSPLFANGISMMIGGVLALIQSVVVGESWAPVPVTNYMQFCINAGLMLIISNFICYNLYGYLLRTYSATFMSFAGLVTPIFSVFYGWLFLNESVTIYFYVSLLLFAIGLIIFYREEIKGGEVFNFS
jgi:drug/metabolite transporter (DMT)-like permease